MAVQRDKKVDVVPPIRVKLNAYALTQDLTSPPVRSRAVRDARKRQHLLACVSTMQGSSRFFPTYAGSSRPTPVK